MDRHILITVLLSLPIVTTPAANAESGVPSPSLSYATIESPGAIHITPAGDGPSLASLGLTVTVHVRGGLDDPIAAYPFQDVYLSDPTSGGLNICPGGGTADLNTNADGVTTISRALAGGGSAQGGLQVYLGGTSLDQAPLPIVVNSPDLSSDRFVNMVDVTLFATRFAQQTDVEAIDFNHDGALDLADVIVLTRSFARGCP